jgi:hypothetical protein
MSDTKQKRRGAAITAVIFFAVVAGIFTMTLMLSGR